MLLNILVISDSARYTEPDVQLLKDRGMGVYTCFNYGIAADMIAEAKPDVIFINPETPGKEATEMYHSLLDNVLFAGLPIIYALVEDDVYLVDKKRTATRDRRNIIADNVIDAIKLALTSPRKSKHHPSYFPTHKIHLGHVAARA